MRDLFDKVIAPIHSDLRGEYCFFCSIKIFDRIKQYMPYPSTSHNCKGKRDGVNCKKSISHFRSIYEKISDGETIEYLNYLATGKIEGHTMPDKLLGYVKPYLKNHHSVSFDRRRKKPFFKIEAYHFFEYTPTFEIKDLKTSDIPFINEQTTNNAIFFTRIYFLLYHIENSLRKFLKKRLSRILGNDWQTEVKSKIDLRIAENIQQELSISDLYTKRGDTILNYCRWEDYGTILREIPKVLFEKNRLIDEFSAHINSMTKIRNATAHHAETIDNNTKKEIDVFLNKFIAILSEYDKK